MVEQRGTPMDANRLWAKTWDAQGSAPKSAYLPGHLNDVYHAAGRVLNATGDAQLQALGVEPEAWRDRLRRVVLLAAAIHDLGKANSQFPEMLKANGRQRLRHEWATLLLLDRQPGLADWLRKAVEDEREWRAVRWAVAGHHPRYDRDAPPELQ